MKKALFCFVLSLISLEAEEILTNNSILNKIKSGASPDSVIKEIETKPSKFEVAANFLLGLQSNGVPGSVTWAMFQKEWPEIKKRLDQDYEEAQLRMLIP